jgi:Uma2 family endonuclease
MVAVASVDGLDLRHSGAEKRLIIDGVPWKTYVLLREGIDSPRLRMTYCEGVLEIMSPSERHELNKKLAARLIEQYSLLAGIPIVGYGSTTFRNEAKARGAEPDECWLVAPVAIERALPDIVLEVIETRPVLDKLTVYAGLGIPEVWIFEDGKFFIYHLGKKGGYARRAKSAYFPDLDFKLLAEFAVRRDHDAAIRAFTATVTTGKRKKRR